MTTSSLHVWCGDMHKKVVNSITVLEAKVDKQAAAMCFDNLAGNDEAQADAAFTGQLARSFSAQDGLEQVFLLCQRNSRSAVQDLHPHFV